MQTPPTDKQVSDYLQTFQHVEIPWNKYFEVNPSRFYWEDGKKPEGKCHRVGKLHVRSILLGFRFIMDILQGTDGTFFARFPQYRAGQFGWSDYFAFDTGIETKSFQHWAADVWTKALVDGEGCLPYRPLRASRYVYNPVTSDGHLAENPQASLRTFPWSVAIDRTGDKGRVVYDDDTSAGDPSPSNATELGQGRAEGEGEEAGLLPSDHCGDSI